MKAAGVDMNAVSDKSVWISFPGIGNADRIEEWPRRLEEHGVRLVFTTCVTALNAFCSSRGLVMPDTLLRAMPGRGFVPDGLCR